MTFFVLPGARGRFSGALIVDDMAQRRDLKKISNNALTS
jgi:hypothetical protein